MSYSSVAIAWKSSGRISAPRNSSISPNEDSRPGAVAAQLALLPDHAELDREPEHVGQVLERLGRLAALRRDAGEALDLRDVGVGEQVPVADHLVDDVRLRRIERPARMAQVLRRVEHAVAERAEEVLQRDEAGRGVEAEAGQGLQCGADLVELGDMVDRQGEPRLRLAEGATREPVVLRGELARDRRPDAVLGLGVLDPRDRVAGPPGERRGRDRVAAAPVVRIVRTGVVVGEVDPDSLGTVADRCVELCLLEHAEDYGARVRAGRQKDVSFRAMTTMERLGDLDRKILALSAAGRAPIVRGHRPRGRALDACRQAPGRPA